MQAVDILLIEDNAGDAVLIRQVLTACPTPIKLHIARDGEQALMMLEDGFQPDLVILDLNIPRISGLVLLERWKLNETPIVVFSSSLNESERKRVMTLGAREFVEKPTDLNEFIDVVSDIIQKWAAPQVNGTAGGV